MKISVIIPVFNTEKYLGYCIDSVVNQNYKNLEIILIDDGSTDNSGKICDEYAKRDARIKVIHKQNEGVSVARNVGINNATGEYIHFIDSDDFLFGNDVYNCLMTELNGLPDIIFSKRVRFSEDLTVKEVEQPDYKSEGLFVGNVLLDVLKNEYELTLTCPVNKLFRTEFLRKNNLYFVKGLMHEEDEWLPRVIASTEKVWFYNRLIYGVRRRIEGSFSYKTDEASMARKARSKMKIAATGMEFMKDKISDELTLNYAAGYYWEYMMSAIINTQKLKDKNLRRENFNYIKEYKNFFKNYKMLLNKKWRIMGLMFKCLGIKFTSKILVKRYAKS
ncbi:MAG: glycosyltransferase [Clostridia bacterium]|nr:glycosyltransferase [Clostridia bacterium]